MGVIHAPGSTWHWRARMRSASANTPNEDCMDGRLAFLFPGQGSQQVGMGLDLYRRFDVVRETFQEAEDLLDLPV